MLRGCLGGSDIALRLRSVLDTGPCDYKRLVLVKTGHERTR